MIEVLNFCKEYKSHRKQTFKVEDVSFTVEKGSITGLVGPNGSGKSTVIKAICGFHYPTSGQIKMCGNDDAQPVDITEQSEKAMELCGYVPEITQLPPDMKVIDFLNYAAKCHGLSKEQSAQSIEKHVKAFNLSDFLNNKIKILSKGQQQRVSFAQALIHDPANLVLDEPINGLDPSQIIAFRELIKKYSKTKAILVSTHILSEVNNICSKAYIMHQGKIYPVKNLAQIEKEFVDLTTKQAASSQEDK